jgi:hypothetical protein
MQPPKNSEEASNAVTVKIVFIRLPLEANARDDSVPRFEDCRTKRRAAYRFLTFECGEGWANV